LKLEPLLATGTNPPTGEPLLLLEFKLHGGIGKGG
jgi:hypothetical protein